MDGSDHRRRRRAPRRPRRLPAPLPDQQPCRRSRLQRTRGDRHHAGHRLRPGGRPLVLRRHGARRQRQRERPVERDLASRWDREAPIRARHRPHVGALAVLGGPHPRAAVRRRAGAGPTGGTGEPGRRVSTGAGSGSRGRRARATTGAIRFFTACTGISRPSARASSDEFDDTQVQVGVEYVYEVAGVDMLGPRGRSERAADVPRPRRDAADATRGPHGHRASRRRESSSIGPRPPTRSRGSRATTCIGTVEPPRTTRRRAPGTPTRGSPAFTTHDYAVSAFNASGIESEKSDPVSARTLDGTATRRAHGPVGGRRLEHGDRARLERGGLDPETGIALYYVYLDGGDAPIDSTAATNYTDDGISGDAERQLRGLCRQRRRAGGAALHCRERADRETRALRARRRTWRRRPPELAASELELERGRRSRERHFDVPGLPRRRRVSRSTRPRRRATTTTPSPRRPRTRTRSRPGTARASKARGASQVEATTPAATDDTPPSTPADFSATATGPCARRAVLDGRRRTPSPASRSTGSTATATSWGPRPGAASST